MKRRIRIQCVADRSATPPWKTQPGAEKAHNGAMEAHRGAVEAHLRAVDGLETSLVEFHYFDEDLDPHKKAGSGSASK